MARDFLPFFAQFQRLFENEMVGFVVLQDGVVAACNRCFARMLGREDGERLAGTVLAELAFPGESRDLLRNILESGPGQACRVGQVLLRRDDGSCAVCRVCRAAPCEAEGLEAPATVLLVQDFSEYSRLEDEYNKSMIDLEEAKLVQEENATMLSEALVQLELAEQAKLEKEKLQGVVELAVAAAHELSQPLQAMQNDLCYLRGVVPEGGDEAAALDALDGAMADLEKIVAKFRAVTSYKTTEYSKGVTMLDLDRAAGEGKGREG